MVRAEGGGPPTIIFSNEEKAGCYKDGKVKQTWRIRRDYGNIVQLCTGDQCPFLILKNENEISAIELFDGAHQKATSILFQAREVLSVAPCRDSIACLQCDGRVAIWNMERTSTQKLPVVVSEETFPNSRQIAYARCTHVHPQKEWDLVAVASTRLDVLFFARRDKGGIHMTGEDKKKSCVKHVFQIEVSNMQFSHCGRYLLTCGGTNNTLCVFSFSNYNTDANVILKLELAHQTTGMCFAPNGEKAAVATARECYILNLGYNSVSVKPLGLMRDDMLMDKVTFSPDGRFLMGSCWPKPEYEVEEDYANISIFRIDSSSNCTKREDVNVEMDVHLLM